MRGVAAVVMLLLLLAGGALIWVQRLGMAWRAGDHTVASLDAAVSVRWDRRGVPHVVADSTDDLAAALGWLHANDRFTAMELGRRAGAGRLAELVGEPAVDTDRYFLEHRVPEVAAAMVDDASPASRRWLERYAEGVNAWLTARGTDLPPGLRLLGADPAPWTPRDSMLFVLLMARDLSFWDDRPEEERFGWLRAFGDDGLRELLLDDDVHVPEAIAALAAGAGPVDGPAAATEPGGADDLAAPGSNNWAVDGSWTAEGASLLANDPHLGLHLPSVWYQVLLRAPGYEAQGMTLPGLPGVVIGRGPHAAWAFTNVMLDDHDLFFEQLDDAGERVRRGDAWLEIETEEQTIRVKDGEPRTITLRRTDRGPLFEADAERGLPARSLAWTAYERGGDPLATMLGVAQARTPEDVLAAAPHYLLPAQNLVVAFDSGALAYTAIGRIPARRAGDGRLPSPGWDLSYGWDGLLPYDENPRAVPPAEGRIVTANADLTRLAGRAPVADFYVPYRLERIEERLDERRDWTREGFEALQLDVGSRFARDVVAALETISENDAPYDGDAQRAYEALASWDGAMRVEGPSALFTLAQKHLFARIFGDEQEAHGFDKPVGHRGSLVGALAGTLSPRWFDDVSTPEHVESRHEVVGAALADAWREGAARWGDDVRRWDYGWLHQLTLRHRLDAAPVFGGWARRGPFPMPGSATTIAAFGARWLPDDTRQAVTYGPSMRWVVDWSAPDVAWSILPGGQAGHPTDPHYDDQIADYLAGRLQEAPWSEAAIERATVERLRLTP